MTSRLHPFEDSGLGRAPFKCVGMAEVPSPSLAASNPAGYNAALAAIPRGYGCGTCAHCGMGLKYNYLIHSSDGQRFAVGSECVLKTGDTRLGSEVERLEAERRREAARIKREAKREAQRQAWLAGKAERDAAREAEERARAERERPAREARRAAWAFVVPVLRSQFGSPFCQSMADAIERGDAITGRPAHIIASVYAKSHGRGGSKKHAAALAEFWSRVEPQSLEGSTP